MAKSKTDVNAEAVAKLALKSWAGRKSDRSAVTDGQNYPDIKLSVRGSVGKKPVRFDVAGRLSVGNANPTGTTKRPTAELMLGILIHRYLPKTKLKKLLEDISDGESETPDQESLDQAKVIISKLSKQSARAGAVSFIEE